MASPQAVLSRVREKRPALDHLIRAFGRYQADAGDRQAASVTFFGFLSFFPIIALATSILSYALGDEAVGTVVREVNNYAPGLAEQLGLETILNDNRKAGVAGLIGLVGLLYSGLGWVDALREAIRAVWHHNVKEGNFLVKKVKDVVILAGLGVTVLLSIGISAATGAFTDSALGLIGQQDSQPAKVLAKLVGLALGVLTSGALFLFLFWRLPKVQSPFRRVLQGALLAAVLFEALKRVGAFYIERTTENPLYGSFAVVVGLLVWINIVSRMLLICAAWVVTAPYDSDVEPSGTASAAAAREAGIPVEFADHDPDEPPTLQEDGAPAPLAAAVQGATPSQDVPEGRGQQSGQSTGRATAAQAGAPARQAAPLLGGASGRNGAALREGPSERSRTRVQQAGQFTAGALGMASMAVLLHVGKTVKGLVRR
ncbi:MAG: ribonuclease [Frankiales bacterium]|nr:ribonuclease [Frankiales bacterium]